MYGDKSVRTFARCYPEQRTGSRLTTITKFHWELIYSRYISHVLWCSRIDFEFHFIDETTIWKYFCCCCHVFSLIFPLLRRRCFRSLNRLANLGWTVIILTCRRAGNCTRHEHVFPCRLSLPVTDLPPRQCCECLFPPCLQLISFQFSLFLEVNPFICPPGRVVTLCRLRLETHELQKPSLEAGLQMTCRLRCCERAQWERKTEGTSPRPRGHLASQRGASSRQVLCTPLKRHRARVSHCVISENVRGLRPSASCSPQPGPSFSRFCRSFAPESLAARKEESVSL